MALSTYNELIDDVIDQSHRKDILTRLPRFIMLAENEMFSNPDQTLEIRESEKTSTAPTSTTERTLALPDGFIQQRDFDIDILENNYPLGYVSPSAMRVRSGTGRPCFFTVTDEIEFDIIPDDTYTVTMRYFAEFTPLSSTNQTNEILTNEPNIYFFGVLKQVFIWSEDTEEAAKYDGLFQDAIRGANKKSKKGRYGKTPTMKYKGAIA